jgi:hypothetical protein
MLFAIVAITAATLGPAGASSLGGKVLKGATIGYLVKQSAGGLDKFINKVTLQKGLSSKMDTKVVPILSVGEKGYVGGAQVCGPTKLVNEVKAVFQYEQNFDNGRYRIKALIPSSSLNPLKLQRVPKVGVSAIIDVSLAGGLKVNYYSGSVGGGEILRAAAVAVGVKAAANSIDKVINTITFNKNGVTEVVPMASFGEKAYIGAAQVSGSTRTIDNVKAVWQYEDLFSNGKFRIKVLVPTNALNPLKMKRVQGVGVTAIIDTSIADQKAPRRDSDHLKDAIRRKLPVKVRPDDRDRHDNGKHKGWYKGKHKGWNKDKD